MEILTTLPEGWRV